MSSSRIFMMAMLALALYFVSSAEASSSRASRILSEKRSINTLKKSVVTSSSVFNGVATWFIPSTEGGSTGACGSFEKDNAMIVALNAPQYGSTSSRSKNCGRTARITHGDKTVEAVVNDVCPECKFGSLDLTQAVFEQLGSLNIGILGITWEFV